MANGKPHLNLEIRLLVLIILILSFAGLKCQNLSFDKNEGRKNTNAQNFVSKVVGLDTIDYLGLHPGINYISIPRHSRLDDPNGNFTLIENVFHRDNFDHPYISFQLEFFQPAAIDEKEYMVTWSTQQLWDFDPEIEDNQQTYSTRGYKVVVNSYHDNNTISLSGLLQNPHTEMQLYEYQENWIGYFLHETQDVFDAIADFEDDIYLIEGEEFYCYRGLPTDGGNPQPTPFNPWVCSRETHNISYGEMVILKPYEDIPDFRWNYSGNPPTPIVDEETEYYSYSKDSGYTPLIIELDSTENPVELGAFINDTCVGACVVDTEDSLVIIHGYLGEQPGDSVIFEEYFGTKSSTGTKINNYYVYNEDKEIHENRVIKTGERKKRYFISLKDKNEPHAMDLSALVSVFPNPANNQLVINYSLPTDAEVVLNVYNVMGIKVITLLNTTQPTGTYTVNWSLKNSKGVKVKNGIYIVQIKINGNIINKKIVVN